MNQSIKPIQKKRLGATTSAIITIWVTLDKSPILLLHFGGNNNILVDYRGLYLASPMH